MTNMPFPASSAKRSLLCLALLGSLLLSVAACGGEEEAVASRPTPSKPPVASKPMSPATPPAKPVAEAASEEPMAEVETVFVGEDLFYACAICHDTEASVGHRIGPNLAGIYDAPSARHADFSYSRAMQEAEVVWDEQMLDAFLAKPRSFMPRNRMAFPGEPNPAKRQALIEYLKTLK